MKSIYLSYQTVFLRLFLLAFSIIFLSAAPPNHRFTTDGSLSFQIVSYDCNSGTLQYKMTGGDGSPINLVLPGIFAGTVSAEALATHTFPGDARVGRTITGYANQSRQSGFN